MLGILGVGGTLSNAKRWFAPLGPLQDPRTVHVTLASRARASRVRKSSQAWGQLPYGPLGAISNVCFYAFTLSVQTLKANLLARVVCQPGALTNGWALSEQVFLAGPPETCASEDSVLFMMIDGSPRDVMNAL